MFWFRNPGTFPSFERKFYIIDYDQVFLHFFSQRKIRKPPSGYVLYAGEIRKKLLQERPDAPFGEISREVGLLVSGCVKPINTVFVLNFSLLLYIEIAYKHVILIS